MRRNRKHRDATPARPWRDRRGREETYAFIVRVRLSIAADGKALRQHFTLEDVAAGSVDRFASFPPVADQLADRIRELVSSPASDSAKH